MDQHLEVLLVDLLPVGQMVVVPAEVQLQAHQLGALQQLLLDQLHHQFLEDLLVVGLLVDQLQVGPRPEVLVVVDQHPVGQLPEVLLVVDQHPVDQLPEVLLVVEP